MLDEPPERRKVFLEECVHGSPPSGKDTLHVPGAGKAEGMPPGKKGSLCSALDEDVSQTDGFYDEHVTNTDVSDMPGSHIRASAISMLGATKKASSKDKPERKMR